MTPKSMDWLGIALTLRAYGISTETTVKLADRISREWPALVAESVGDQ